MAPGVRYVPVVGGLELLPRIRLVPTPGHTYGSQVVVVETDGHPIVIAGDTAVFFAVDEPSPEGQRLVHELGPKEVWLSHEHEPWRPPRTTVSDQRGIGHCAAHGRHIPQDDLARHAGVAAGGPAASHAICALVCLVAGSWVVGR